MANSKEYLVWGVNIGCLKKITPIICHPHECLTCGPLFTSYMGFSEDGQQYPPGISEYIGLRFFFFYKFSGQDGLVS